MENNITALLLMDKGMQEEKDAISLEQLMDGVIILQTKEEGKIVNNQLLVKKMKGSKLIPREYYILDFEKGEGPILKENA